MHTHLNIVLLVYVGGGGDGDVYTHTSAYPDEHKLVYNSAYKDTWRCIYLNIVLRGCCIHQSGGTIICCAHVC
jgi:hypothetical protein